MKSLRRTMVGHVRDVELHRRIADAGLLELIEFIDSLQGEIVKRRLGVQAQRRLELFRLQNSAGDFIDADAKRLDLLRLDGHARSHRVSAMFYEKIAALTQRFRQIEALNAPA